ncbi:condensation domain-containing protein, partial [Nonomuraea sp. K271]
MTERVPLSYPQHRLWLMERLRPQAPTFNVPLGVWLEGPFDVRGLGYALQETVRRHESLRTVIESDGGGEPAQVVQPPVPTEPDVLDLRGSSGDLDALALRHATEYARRPFRLDAPPLLRVLAVRVADDRHLLVIVAHHIVSDGWSTGLLVAELARHYTAHHSGTPEPQPSAPAQYRDFATWQRALVGTELAGQLAFWRRYLDGAPRELELPTDRPRPPVQGFRGRLHRFALPTEVARGARHTASALGATPHMLALTAFAGTLARYSGVFDLVIGTPVANRPHPDFEELIGYCGNLLATRVDLTGAPTFAEAVLRTRRSVLSTLEHQDVPFELLVEELGAGRDPSRHPLFQCLMVTQDFLPRSAVFGAARARYVELDNETSKADLYLTLDWHGGHPHGSVQYDSDLFDPVTVAAVTEQFLAVLGEGCREPGRRLAHLATARSSVHAEGPPPASP